MKRYAIAFAVLLSVLVMSLNAFAATDGFYQFSEVQSAWEGTDGDRTKEPSPADYDYTYGDEDTLPYTLPWPFSFYGVTYNSIKVDTNGNIWFGEAANGPAHSFELARTYRGPVIAAWNNDLSSYYYGGVFVQHKSSPERVVIEWQAETYSDEGYYKPNNFEVVLYRNGTFRIDYNSFAAALSDSGSGISNDDNRLLSLTNLYAAGKSFAFGDNVPPALAVNAVASPTKASSVTLSGSREENATISISVDTSASIGETDYPTPTTWSSTVTSIAEGVNNFTITASDLTLLTTAVTVTVTRDSTAPEVSASPAGGPYTGTQNVQLIASEPGRIYYTLNGTTPTTASAVYDVPLSITPPKTLNYFAEDLLGNPTIVHSEEYKVGFSVDASAGNGGTITPATGIVASGDSATLTITPDIGYRFDTLTDNGTNVTSSVTGNTYSISNVIGHHTVVVTFADNAPPVLNVSTLVSGSYTKNKVLNIAGTVTDNIAVTELKINSVVVPVSPDGSFSYAFLLSNGPNNIAIMAKDQAGNQAMTTRTITFDLATPNLTISAPVDSARTTAVLATVTGTMDESSTVTAKLGGNVQAASVNGTNFSTGLTFAPGLNTIEVTATDLAGKTNTQKRTVVYDYQKPDLTIASPSQDIRTTQSSITIIGTATAPTGAVTVSIAVDGQTYIPAVVSGSFQQVITFSSEKKYRIVVTATNEAGAVSTVQREVIYTSFDDGSILINGGAALTNSASGSLALFASSGSSAVTQMQFSKDGEVTWTPLEAYATSRSISLTPAGDGVKTVAVRYKNALGALSPPYSAAITISTVPPTGSIVINNGATYTATTSVSLALSATSPNGISQMQFSKDNGVTWFPWENYATTRSITLAPAGDGLKTISVRYKDVIGNISPMYTGSITLYTVQPTGSIVINNGADYTVSSTAVLALSAASSIGVTHMQLSKDGGITWYAWESYVTTRTVTLTPAGDGLKTVSVRYKDTAGNVSPVYTDSVAVGTTTCDIEIEGGADVTNKATVTLALSATSPLAVTQMQFSKDEGITWSTWESYATTRNITLAPAGDGLKTVRVKYKDAAGLIPGSCLDSITTDNTPPAGTIVINGGAGATSSPYVTLTLSATDAHAVTEMQFSKDNVGWFAFEAYTTTRTATVLLPDAGTKYFYVRFKDGVGNVSTAFSDSIQYAP